jgi:hypothetical protein
MACKLRRVNYHTLLALTRSLRVWLARRLVGWDSSARNRLVAQGQTPSPDALRLVSSQKPRLLATAAI